MSPISFTVVFFAMGSVYHAIAVGDRVIVEGNARMDAEGSPACHQMNRPAAVVTTGRGLDLKFSGDKRLSPAAVATVSETTAFATIPGAIAFSCFSTLVLELARAAETAAITRALGLLNEARL